MFYYIDSFDRYCQKIVLGGETRHQPVSPRNFEILFAFPNLRPISFIEFSILDMKHCFTCGKLKFHGDTLNCRDIMSLIVD